MDEYKETIQNVFPPGLGILSGKDHPWFGKKLPDYVKAKMKMAWTDKRKKMYSDKMSGTGVPWAKFTEDQIREIRQYSSLRGFSVASKLAEEFNTTYQTIYRIWSGQVYPNVT